jgi:hypothetical protein
VSDDKQVLVVAALGEQLLKVAEAGLRSKRFGEKDL